NKVRMCGRTAEESPLTMTQASRSVDVVHPYHAGSSRNPSRLPKFFLSPIAWMYQPVGSFYPMPRRLCLARQKPEMGAMTEDDREQRGVPTGVLRRGAAGDAPRPWPWLPEATLSVADYRGRESRLASVPPPSEPYRRISRIRLSGRWS